MKKPQLFSLISHRSFQNSHFFSLFISSLKNLVIVAAVTAVMFLTGCQQGIEQADPVMRADSRVPLFEDDFESGDAAWGLSTWAAVGQYKWETGEGHSGNHCISLSNAMMDIDHPDCYPGFRVLTNQEIPLEPDKNYYVSFWARSDGKLFRHAVGIWHSFIGSPGNIFYQTNKFLNLANWYKIEYVLGPDQHKGRNLRIGIILEHTPGKLYADDFLVREATADETQRLRYIETPHLDPASVPTTATPPQGQAGAHATIQNINGKWWATDPQGNGHFMISYQSQQSSAAAVHYSWAVATYTGVYDGYQNYELQRAMPFMDDMGFNGINGWCSQVLGEAFKGGQSGWFHDRMIFLSRALGDSHEQTKPYEVWRYDGLGYSETHAGAGSGYSHGMADPWNTSWRSGAAAMVADWVGPGSENGWTHNYPGTIQVSVDGEADGKLLEYMLWSPACSLELVNWLSDKYGTIDTLNTAWSQPGYKTYDYPAFSNIRDDAYPSGHPVPLSWDGQAGIDLRAFVRVLLSEYYGQTYSITKNVMTTWAVASNKYSAGYLSPILKMGNADLLSVYDSISLQWTAEPGDGYTGMTPQNADILKNLQEAAQKPVWLSEWMVNSTEVDFDLNDERLAVARGFYPTQALKGDAYAIITAQMASLPYVYGMQYWHYDDSVDDENFGCGFVRSVTGPGGMMDAPYHDFTDRVKACNMRIKAIDPSCRTWDGGNYQKPETVTHVCKCTQQPMATGILAGILLIPFTMKKRAGMHC